MLKIEIRTAATAAVKQPFTLNLGTSLDTIISEKPFIRKRNKPKVRIVMGSVKRIRNGLTTAFTTARIKAEIIAVKKSSTINSLVSFPTR